MAVELLNVSTELLPLGSSPLHVLANSNDTKSLTLLIHSLPDIASSIDAVDHHGRTPLVVALQNGRFEAACILVKLGANLDDIFSSFSQVHEDVHVFICPPYVQFIEALIDQGIKLPLDSTLLIPLMVYSAYEGNESFLEIFLNHYDHEVDIDSVDHLGSTALHYASQRGELGCTKVLLKYGANTRVFNSQGMTPLHLACASGHERVVEVLLQEWVTPDPQIVLNMKDHQGRTPLHICLYFKQFKLFEYLATNYLTSIDLQVSDSAGYTLPCLLFFIKLNLNYNSYRYMDLPILGKEEATWLLHESVIQCNLDMLEISIAHGAVVSCFDFMQQSPLILASKMGSLDICRVLIENGADLNAFDIVGNTALHYAFKLGHHDVAQYLLSLPGLDPTMFYSRYNDPLSPNHVHTLVDYFSKYIHSKRPLHWCKWITLAAQHPNMNREAFCALIDEICPKDWPNRLVIAETSAQTSKECPASGHSVLPTLVVSPTSDDRNLTASPKKRNKKRPPPFSHRKHSPPTISFVCVKSAKRVPDTKWFQDQPKPFQFHFQRFRYFPLHEAVVHKNVNIFSYIVSKAMNTPQHLNLVKQLLVGVKDTTNQTVVEHLGMNFQAFKSILEELNLIQLVKKHLFHLFPLPDGVTLNMALLHYLVSGGPQSVSHVTSARKSKTPVDQWPQWYLQLALTEVYNDMLGQAADATSLCSKGGGKQLANVLLSSEPLPLNESLNKYPCFLYAAVMNSCVWGVEVLLQNGASPMAKFRERYAIVIAAERCQIEILDLFLLNISQNQIHMHTDDKGLSVSDALPSALVSLANCGFVDIIEKFLGMFNVSNSLWSSYNGPRLLYVLLSLKSEYSLSVVVELVKDVMSFLCKPLLVEEEMNVSQPKVLKQLQVYLPLMSVVDHPYIHLFSRFLKFCRNFYYDFGHMFHYLCGSGDYDLVTLVTNSVSDAQLPHMLNKLDSEKRAPLFYAACGGHLKVVELLIDRGAIVYSEEQDPPIKALLMYLVRSPFTNCSGELYMTSRRITHAIRLKFYRKLKRDLPSFCSFDSELFSNQLDITQLVNLLLPTTDELKCLLEKYLFQIITMLSTVRNLDPLKELLLDILRIIEKTSFDFKLSLKDEKELCSFEGFFSDVVLGTMYCKVTTVDVAVCLVPYSDSSSPEVKELHDSMLVKCAKDPTLLDALSVAAEKGMWGLVMNTLPNIISKQKYQQAFLQKHLSIIWYQAILVEQRDIFDSFYTHVSNTSTLITAAIKHGRFHMVESFLSDPDCLYIALSASIRYKSMDIFAALCDELTNLESHKLTVVLNALVAQSVKYVNEVSLNSLLTLYNDPTLNIKTEFQDKVLSFWYVVLSVSAKFGNERFGLMSVSSIPEFQMESIVKHDQYLDIINGCCYWGMLDLIQCLPITSQQLFQKSSHEAACPFETAIANGHLGKLSVLPEFPSLSDALAQFPQVGTLTIRSLSNDQSFDLFATDNVVTHSLFNGVFHKILSMQDDLPSMPQETVFQHYGLLKVDCVYILLRAIAEGLTSVAEVCIEHLGKYAGDVLHLLEINVSKSRKHSESVHLLFVACSKFAIKDNYVVLDLLLDTLQKSNLLYMHLNRISPGSSQTLFKECLMSTVLRGSIKCTQRLLQCIAPGKLSFDFKQSFKNGDTLLHLAVYSKNAIMVDLVLEHLEDTVDSCYVMNSYNECPLYLALALGCTDIIHNSRLIEESCKSVKFYELENNLYPQAILAHGWFHNMMLNNSSSIGSHTNVQSSTCTCAITPRNEVNIRLCNDVWKLLVLAANYQEYTLVDALLFVSPCEILLRFKNIPLFLLRSTHSLKLMKRLKIDFEPLMPVLINQLSEMINCEDYVLQILDMIEYDDHHALLIKETFLTACALNKMKVVKYLLQKSQEVVVIQLALIQDKDALKKGLAQAIALGCFDIAAFLQLEYDLPFEKHQLPACVQLTDLTQQIFACKTYYELLEDFFQSTTRSASTSVCRNFPLAAAWLAHYWSEEEALLIMRKVGGTSGTNPWKIDLTSNSSGPTELSLHVDWDSFSGCLLHSPHVDSPTSKFRYTPLLAEATVFSPVILGEILQSLLARPGGPFSSQSVSFDLFALAGNSNLSSVILSCDTWPAVPSCVSMNNGEQCVLSLSYKPSEGVFVFPDTTIAMFNTSDLDSIASGIDDSGIHFSFEKVSTINDLPNDIAHCYIVQIRRMFHNKVKVRIQYSESILDSTAFNFLQSHLALCLDDCMKVLKLMQIPALRYSHVVSQLHSIGIEGTQLPGVKFQLLFNKLYVYFDLTECQCVNVSIDSDILSIAINITCNSDFEDVGCPTYEALLQSIVTCLLDKEVEKDKEKFKKAVNLKVLPKLKKALKIGGSLDEDLLSLTVKDHCGHTYKMDSLTAQHYVYIKSLTKLRTFLSHLFTMLHVLSFKPKLQTSLRNIFDAGFKISLTLSDDASYAMKGGIPHLAMSSQSLLNGSCHDLLFDILKSLIETTSYLRRGLALKDFTSQIPAPVLCYVDIETSMGLLYPVMKARSTLFIQLVDYNRQNLSTKPTINSVVEITLISPTLKKLHLVYNDDECVVVSSPDKQLIVHFTSTGKVQIDWIPQEPGLYSIFISLNSVPIRGSPFKCWCSESDPMKNIGTRKAIAGFPLTFVVEHNHLKPQCNYHNTCDPLVHLHKRAPIKPLCIAALKPYYERELTSIDDEAQDSTSSSANILHEELLKADRHTGVHHISLTSNVGTICQIPAHPVTVHIAPDNNYDKTRLGNLFDQPKEKHFDIQCIPLSNGMYTVILKCTKACTFKVFVSCPMCQSVMKVHWRNKTMLLPSMCYVLPGVISPYWSSVMFTSPYVHKGSYIEKFKVVAGSTVSFTITARDKYQNEHTSGGAVKRVFIKGAGQRNLREGMTWSQLSQAVSRPVSDVQCRVHDNQNGTYTVDGDVYITGVHSVFITDQYSSKVCLVKKGLLVTSGPAFPPHCHFSAPNGLEATVSQTFICTIDLYDKHMNSCDSHEVLSQVQASIGGIVLRSMSGAQAVKRRLIMTTPKPNTVVFYFVPQSSGQQELLIHVNGVLHPICPMVLNVAKLSESFSKKFSRLRTSLRRVCCVGYTPTLTVNRTDILESSVRIFSTNPTYFKKIIRVRFGEEMGIDAGGISSEFFHLLCLEFVNPQYALFQCLNGLYKPSPNSNVNANHLIYFEFFGKVLAKCICDGHQITVRFTPAVYKYLLGQECSLDDLKIEDPSLHKGLLEIMDSQSEEDLEHLVHNFTTVKSHFGALQTIELEQGGENRKVTMANRYDFVQKLFTWHLTGCVQKQLDDLKKGFNFLISSSDMSNFSAHELEVILSGQPVIDIEFIKGRTVYSGYSSKSQEIEWLWEVLKSFTQEQRCQFLQFTTGCACLPTADMGQWKLTVQRGATDSSLLPQAATCFNSITLPVYHSKNNLRSKLELAILYGKQTFLNY